MINSSIKIIINNSFEFKIWHVNKNLSSFLLLYIYIYIFQLKYNIKYKKNYIMIINIVTSTLFYLFYNKFMCLNY